VSAEVQALPDFDTLETWCMFFGYPRSGHSLVGALLNAHPEMLMSIELDALSRVRDGVGRAQLFAEIAGHERRFAADGRQHMSYDYTVDGAWQGRWRTLKVIGDKKGGRSSWWLHDEPELLDRLRETVRLPMRFIHVVRSVWDNIATISTRGMDLDRAIAWYFETCEAVAGIKARLPAESVFEMTHEGLIAAPHETLFALAGFLGIDRDRRWADACAAMISPRPSRTRHRVMWTAAQKAEVRRQVPRFAWLSPDGMRFELDDDTPRAAGGPR